MDKAYVEFEVNLHEVGVWLDKAEDALRHSDTMPADQQASDAEVQKFKVSGQNHGSERPTLSHTDGEESTFSIEELVESIFSIMFSILMQFQPGICLLLTHSHSHGDTHSHKHGNSHSLSPTQHSLTQTYVVLLCYK